MTSSQMSPALRPRNRALDSRGAARLGRPQRQEQEVKEDASFTNAVQKERSNKKHNAVRPDTGTLFSLKKKEILTPATMWMDLEIITLRESTNTLRFHSHEGSGTVTFVETESGAEVAGGWGGSRGLCSMGRRLSLGRRESPGGGGGDGCTTP